MPPAQIEMPSEGSSSGLLARFEFVEILRDNVQRDVAIVAENHKVTDSGQNLPQAVTRPVQARLNLVSEHGCALLQSFEPLLFIDRGHVVVAAVKAQSMRGSKAM